MARVRKPRSGALSASGADGADDEESRLLRACLAGDEAARARFIEGYTGLVVWAIRVTFRRYDRPLQEDEVRDLTHDVFLSLFDHDARKLRQFSGRNDATLATWLRVVVTRFAIDRLRRVQRTISLDDPENPESVIANEGAMDESPGPEAEAVDSDRHRRIRALVEDLPPTDRLFVRLFYFEGLPIEEVAGVLGISRNAAYVRKMRLHGRLRTLLKSRYEEGL